MAEKKRRKSQDPAPRNWKKYLNLNDALIAWASLYFGYILYGVIFSGIINNIAQDGLPGVLNFFTQYKFLDKLAQRYPAPFWGIVIALTVLAFVGAALAVWDLRQKFHRQVEDKTQYLRRVAEVYKVIPLVIDPKPENNIPLPDTVYQNLQFQQNLSDAIQSNPSSADNQSKTVTANVIFDVIQIGNTQCIVILGAPGGGKTTLLRQSVSKMAQKFFGSKKEYSKERKTRQSAGKDEQKGLPVYIALPNFAQYVEGTIDVKEPIKQYLNKYDIDLFHSAEFIDYIADEAAGGRIYVFLDGLDEVPPGLRADVYTWIREYRRVITPSGAIILGARFTDYDARLLQGEDVENYQKFAAWSAQPMDHEIREHMAPELLKALWAQFEEKEPEKARLMQKPEAEQFINLVEQSTEHSALLGENPLMFSLAAYIYTQVNRKALPAARTLLYQAYLTALLAKVAKKRQKNDTEADLDALLMHMLNILAEVSLQLFLLEEANSEQQISMNKAAIFAALEQYRSIFSVSTSAEDMITWVINSGALTTANQREAGEEDQNALYEYRHHTIQEYLIASALVTRLLSAEKRLNDGSLLVAGTIELRSQKRFSRRWFEPMRMLAGTLHANSLQNRLSQGSNAAVDWLQELEKLAQNSADAESLPALELLVASLSEIPELQKLEDRFAIEPIAIQWAETLLSVAETPENDWLGRFQRLSAGIAALGPRYARPALELLEAALLDDTNIARQIAAARAMEGLGELIGAETGALKRSIWEGSNPQARAAAAHTTVMIEKSGKRLGQSIAEEGLRSGNAAIAQAIAAGLVGAGLSVLGIMRMAAAKDQDSETRRLGVQALASLGTVAAEDLQTLAADADETVAAAALAALQNIGVASSLLPRALRQLGFELKTRNGVRYIIPPLCAIPAGEFLMGSDKQKDPQAYDDELPQFTFTLEEYAIGKYPVTVAEYALFMQATHREAPENWDNQKQRPEHPVVNVSWEDVQAYAQWLSEVTGQPYRLPSEAEWEKAARGPDGWIYPWGNEWGASKANTREKGPGTTTPVGSYPQGASPYGVMDMAGNVWEWTSTIYVEKYPYKNDRQHEDLNSTNTRVLRGGSWYVDSRDARAADRYDFRLVNSGNNGGARLAVSRFVAGSKRT